MILTGSADKTARLIARADGKVIRTLANHNGPVRSVAFSPDGDRIATADAPRRAEGVGDDNGPGRDCVRAHGDLEDRRFNRCKRVAFSGPGSLVSASADGTLKTWRFRGSVGAPQDIGAHMYSACWPLISARMAACWRRAGVSLRDRAR